MKTNKKTEDRKQKTEEKFTFLGLSQSATAGTIALLAFGGAVVFEKMAEGLKNLAHREALKAVLVFVLCVFSVTLFAQGDFKPENGAVIWQKVYEVQEGTNIDDLATQLADVSHNGARLTGNIKNSNVNYTAQGVTRMQMPVYMCYDFNAAVVIEQKAGRYRVTVNNIAFKEASISNHAPEKFNGLADYALKSTGELRKSQLKALEVFSNDLEQRFTIKQKVADW